MTSQAGKQTVAIHILPNISKCSGNQTREFCSLIEQDVKKTSSQG